MVLFHSDRGRCTKKGEPVVVHLKVNGGRFDNCLMFGSGEKENNKQVECSFAIVMFFLWHAIEKIPTTTERVVLGDSLGIQLEGYI